LIQDVSKNSLSHGAIPFWSWNDKLEESELRRQINNMYDLGMKGFFMHARMGLETDYLSDEWYHAIDVCIDEARKLGMEAWSYDENGWPSGFGGGKVLEKPENYATFITRATSNIFPENPEKYLGIYAIVDGKCQKVSAPVDGISEYHTLEVGHDVSYVDIFNRRVIREFIDSTHEDYKKRVAKEDFGTTMPGFFTDEPQYFRRGMPWSAILPEEFAADYGYDVVENLIKLFVDCEGYREFRYDYFKLLSKLYIDSFVKQVYDWCEENGCQLTGHTIEESSISGQMGCCAGVMSFYRYQHIPGVDWLGRKTSPKSDMMGKQIGSVCAQTGRDKAITETFALCGWDVSPAELKNIADYQFSGGLNMLCHHLYPYSIRGQRKRDYPAHYSDYLPWQKHLKDFNLYYNHLGYMLSLGQEHANTLVIHPLRQAYMYYQRELAGKSIEKIERETRVLSDKLSGNQIAYHYGDESMMEDMASVEGNTIRVGLCTYDTVVIPSMETLSANTAALLEQFVKNGGKVYCEGTVPNRIDAREADLSWLNANTSFDDLKAAQEVTLSCDGKAVPYARVMIRKTDKGRIIFVTNFSKNVYKNVEITVKGCNNLVKLDILSLAPVKLCGEKTGDNFCAKVNIDNSESFMLIESDEIAAAPLCEFVENVETFKLPNSFRFVEMPTNSLTMDNLSYSFDGINFVDNIPLMQLKDELLRARYEGDLYIKHTFRVDQLPASIHYVCEPMDYLAHTVNGKEITLTASKYLDPRFLSADITDLVKVGDNEICYKLHYFQSQHVYDVLFSDVSESFRNCLSIDTEIECTYLFGDFAVKTDRAQYTEVKNEFSSAYTYTGDFAITRQKDTVDITNVIKDGYPFFGGTLDLVTEYEYKKGGATELVLDGRFAVAEVFVDGKPARKMLFDNHVDLSALLTEGKNTIRVKLTNAQRNLLGPLHNNEIEPLGVGPRTFTGEKQWVDGNWAGYLKDRYCFVRFGFDCE
jgi:hypothetical protein